MQTISLPAHLKSISPSSAYSPVSIISHVGGGVSGYCGLRISGEP